MANARQFMAARTAAWSGKALPYDAEVDWIENTEGGEFINLGMKNALSIEFKIDYTPIRGLVTYPDLFGFYNENSERPYFQYLPTSGIYDIPKALGANRTKLRTVSFGTKVVDSLQNGYFYRNGTQIRSGIYTSSNYYNSDTWLFGRNTLGSLTSVLIAKVHSAQFFMDGELFLDMKPVRVGNVGYLYDLISKRLLGNSGTGAFVIGPDKTI